MSETNDPIRPTTPEAIHLARTLLRTARHGAIAVLDPETRRPLASRVAVATDVDGTPLILVSGLAAHTPGLFAHPACSLLLGEPGKGDPLAHPRVTIHCRAMKIDRASQDYGRARRRYLNHNPKGALYVDLGDFVFFQLHIERASLNGGFGKAFNLQPEDLLCPATASHRIATGEQAAIDTLNENRAEEISLYAAKSGGLGATRKQWKVIGLDPDGIDLASGDNLVRLSFQSRCDSVETAISAVSSMLDKAD